MSMIDWSGELEAYHEDGRVVPVTFVKDDGSDLPMKISPAMHDSAGFAEWFYRDETRDSGGWRIRNVQPAPSADRLARLEAFVARVAGGHPSSGFVWNDQAKALVAELNPVDPDVLVARKIALEHALPGAYDGITTYECNEGKADDKPYMAAIVEALRQAHKEGNDNEK